MLIIDLVYKILCKFCKEKKKDEEEKMAKNILASIKILVWNLIIIGRAGNKKKMIE